MFRPGTGTWFTFMFTISDTGAVDARFNYDDEPEWSRPQEPVLYVEDMERFPRDAAHTPAWLQEKLHLRRIQDTDTSLSCTPRYIRPCIGIRYRVLWRCATGGRSASDRPRRSYPEGESPGRSHPTRP